MGEVDDDRSTPLPAAAWEQVFAHSPIAMGVAVDFTYVEVNEAYCELVGRPRSEIVGTDSRRFFSADLPDEVRRIEQEVADGEPRVHLELPFVHGDGSERWASIDAVLITGGACGEITTVVQAVDTTELRATRLDQAASERRTRKLLANTRDIVVLTDGEGEILYSTLGHNQALGFGAEFWSEVHPRVMLHPDSLEAAGLAWREALARPGEILESEVRIQDAQGQWIDVMVSTVNLLHDEDVAGIMMTASSITELRAAERLASSQADVLELIARGAPLPEILDQCLHLVHQNGVEGATALYLLEGDRLELRAGATPPQVAELVRDPPRTPPRSLCDEAIENGEAAFLPDLREGPAYRGLRDVVLGLGRLAAWSQPIYGAGGTVVGTLSTTYDHVHTPSVHEQRVAELACSLVSIALERVATEDRLAHQALHDSLTDLPNRSLLLDRLDHALARRTRNDADIAVLFCDLDRFKVVNDSLGHSVGDQLLVAFAERLVAAVDPGDTVARFGGDEFVVLLEDLHDAGRSLAIAERIMASLERPFPTVKGQDVYLTASIGLATASDHTTGDGWLRDADAAMYRAKERGRNRVELFDTAMREAAVTRLQIENDLRRAVDRDELTVHYQPIVDLRSGRMIGVEALVRWQHPVRGLLAPDSFIPVAEETGTIATVGRHVLDQAVGELAELVRRVGVKGFALSVNLSARQLDGRPFDEEVDAICRRHDWAPRDLLLEITESALTDETTAPRTVLRRIRDLGVDLAIDDFGTGHSSLTRLGNLPVNQVKIDRTFVREIDGGEERLVRIVDSVVAVAGALDLTTCAEGVESQAQLDYLRRIRCDLAQGYFFSKPLPIDELEAILTADPRW